MDIDDLGLWHCCVTFRSNFVIVGTTRGSPDDAENDAAWQVLINLCYVQRTSD